MTTIQRPANADYGAQTQEHDEVRAPATNARQGVTGHNVRYVLTIGLIGVVAGMGLAYLIFFFA